MICNLQNDCYLSEELRETLTKNTMKATVELYDKNGNEAGTEEIEIIELYENCEYRKDTDEHGDIGYWQTINVVEVICSDKVNKDDIVATLDNIYGYFNYKIV
jgi:hypothetical protein